MELLCLIARALHTAFPFSQLRTAQILTRPGLRLHRRIFDYNISLRPDLDTFLLLLYLQGERIVEDATFLASYIQPGATAVDIGANVGYTTLFFCRACGPEGVIYAFEPEDKRPESTRLSFAGRVGKSTNWDRRRRTRNSSSEREAVSSKEVRKGTRRLPPSTDQFIFEGWGAVKSDESTEFGSLADFDLQLLIV
jgi:hypothetical protein